ncbi:MAG: DNA-processing protein DprA [Paludibacter sp.]|nr:DNA-processing protein DprA [Bacteroidales bacterium]MCM1068555.1 DNA-processing protein DprA [Prevotella sp.]MCM1353219.1 DNA-processing protein DprA [Bacteroides sp.]MCM1442373.1 DNA-processing protein DprA [Muribaculum sp.]MCM1481192.1 DNA-processing protein DprA [Paludibacter sp.]
MSKEELLKYNIAISLLPGVGLKRAKLLIDFFGDAHQVFLATEKELSAIPNIGKDALQALVAGRSKALKRAERELDFIATHQIDTYFYQDNNFPYRLQECPDAPLLLYGKGNLQANVGHMLAVVGTRMPTERGKEHCRQIILDLAQAVEHLTIVSGLAYGIDITAHRAALEAGIPTIIIPGHGLDRIYPAIHRQTAIQALEKGGILTEYMSGTNPDRQNFVARNRIIAGMSDATLVVESKTKGGSLITADIANSYDRDVFAIPGRPNDELSCGCNELIKTNKAALVENAEDIIMAMQWDARKVTLPIQTAIFCDLSPTEETLMQLLRKDCEGIHVNLLVMESHMPYSEITSTLLQMEFKGLVKALPGGIYRALT